MGFEPAIAFVNLLFNLPGRRGCIDAEGEWETTAFGLRSLLGSDLFKDGEIGERRKANTRRLYPRSVGFRSL